VISFLSIICGDNTKTYGEIAISMLYQKQEAENKFYQATGEYNV